MATITGYTAERMQTIEDEAIVDAYVSGDNLILVRHDSGEINAGSVRGPEGPEGPVGSDLAVLSAQQILEIGMANQIRAGRQLTAADFTNMGLAAPIALWNLANVNDSSGNGRNLVNKGSVPFDAAGINGGASTAARLVANTAQALYIVDTGAADPFRIKVGSMGAWIKTPKKATSMVIMSKYAASPQYGWELAVNANEYAVLSLSQNGTSWALGLGGATKVVDNRWHFIVATYDGIDICIYVDGNLDGRFAVASSGVIFGTSGPLNIGSWGADSVTASSAPFNGNIDEAFVSGDVLTEDQVLNLYCAKISHTLGAVPNRVLMKVYRKRRGAALVVGDFPSTPLRLYNFSAGALTDTGSNNTTLTNNNSTPTVAGADGLKDNAFRFASGSSHNLSSTDTGLPSGTNTRSFGCWFKTRSTASQTILGYGSAAGSSCGVWVGLAGAQNGALLSQSGADAIYGPLVCDGEWHHLVVVEENAPADGIKRKVYVDGKLVANSTVLNSVTLGGANRFRIGAQPDLAAGVFFDGQIDSVFVIGAALTAEQIRTLYMKSSQQLAASPKEATENVEAMTSTDLYAVFNSLEPQDLIDLRVA